MKQFASCPGTIKLRLIRVRANRSEKGGLFHEREKSHFLPSTIMFVFLNGDSYALPNLFPRFDGGPAF